MRIRELALNRIVDAADQAIASDAVLVLPTYDEVFGDSEKTARVLVRMTSGIMSASNSTKLKSKDQVDPKALEAQAKSKLDLASEISRVFIKNDDEFYAGTAPSQR